MWNFWAGRTVSRFWGEPSLSQKFGGDEFLSRFLLGPPEYWESNISRFIWAAIHIKTHRTNLVFHGFPKQDPPDSGGMVECCDSMSKDGWPAAMKRSRIAKIFY